jgi:outer membrane biosynthesis protein TonB
MFRRTRAVVLSLALHASLIAGLLWSDKIFMEFLKATHKDRQMLSATLLMDRTYKATDTMMKKGPKEKNLPPPKIDIAKKEEIPTLSKKLFKKKDLKDILNKIRQESSAEKRPPPKEDNFPTNEKGEKGAHGTGGRGDRILSPAEQALQSAMRKYYELEGAEIFRKQYPNAQGYLTLKLVGTGNQFQIATLVLSESTGFNILDRNCEAAVRKAVDRETFSRDVISELAGKETVVTCKP